MYSTADDLLKFLRAAYGGRLTTPAHTLELFGDPTKMYQPTGRNPGYSAVAFTDVARDTFVVTLANNGASLDNFGRRIYQAALGEAWDVEPLAAVTERLPAARATDFAGTFIYEGFGIEPFLLLADPDGDWLVNHRDSDVIAAMVPLAGGRWLHPLIDAICKPESAGQIVALSCVSVIKRRQDKPFRIVRTGS